MATEDADPIQPKDPAVAGDWEALRTLSDKPVEDDASDQLGFAAYADALAELLDHPDTDTPLTVAISAPWGSRQDFSGKAR
jgi:hypothetical protein